jgi:hypothetical protein
LNLGFGFDFRVPFEIGRVGGFDFLLTTRTRNVKGFPPFAKGANDGAAEKSEEDSTAESKTKPQARQKTTR